MSSLGRASGCGVRWLDVPDPDGKLFCKERVELAGGKLWLAPGFTILMLLLLLVTAVGAFRLG